MSDNDTHGERPSGCVRVGGSYVCWGRRSGRTFRKLTPEEWEVERPVVQDLAKRVLGPNVLVFYRPEPARED